MEPTRSRARQTVHSPSALAPQLSLGASDASRNSTHINTGTMHTHVGARVKNIIIHNHYYTCKCNYHKCEEQCNCTQANHEGDSAGTRSVCEEEDDASVTTCETYQTEYLTASEGYSLVSLSSLHETSVRDNGNNNSEDDENQDDDTGSPIAVNSAVHPPATQFQVIVVSQLSDFRRIIISQCEAIMKNLKELSDMHSFLSTPVLELRAVVTLGLYCRGSNPKVLDIYQRMCVTMSVLLLLRDATTSTMKVLKINMPCFLAELIGIIHRCRDFCNLCMSWTIGSIIKRATLESKFAQLCEDLSVKHLELVHVIKTYKSDGRCC